MINDEYYKKVLKEKLMKKSYIYEKEYNFDDYNSIWKEKSYAREHDVNHLLKTNKSLKQSLNEAEGTIHSLTEGNEPMQRALIQQDPLNIRYIRNPYVSIQLEAIAANPEAFNHIQNPSQEAIDTYRIVK